MAIETAFLARHGETRWNVAGRCQGQLDSQLTAAGLAQAAENARRVSGEGIDGVFASPLGRAVRTAAVIGSRLGLPVVLLDELAEIHHGAFAGRTRDELDRDFAAELVCRVQDKYRYRFPGGESYADADARARAALARIGPARPLIVSHEMIGRMLLRNLLDLAPAEALALHHPHAVVYRVDVAARTLSELA